MTTTIWDGATPPPADPGDDGPAGADVSAPGRDAKGWWRRARWPIAVAVIVLLAALIAALTIPGDQDRNRLGPGNPAPEGARALVRILGDQGVRVRELRTSLSVLEAAGESAGATTIVVTRPGLLGPEQLDRLAEAHERGARLVLVEPDDTVLARLTPEVYAAGLAGDQVLDPGCAAPEAQAAGTALAGGHLYAVNGNPPDGGSPAAAQAWATCYGGAYLTDADAAVTIVGQGDLLSNGQLDKDGNAALALHALGAEPNLLWYTPDPLELSSNASPPSIRELLPRWVLWVGIQLVLAVLVAMLWRGNRLGKLVHEPLPVVVRAAETQEGRARLYRQASARGRAAATLRTAALRRFAARVAAPAGTTPEQVVALVAAATGRDEAALRTILLGPEPSTDGELVTLADDLDAVQSDLSRDLNERDARQ